HDLKVPDEQVEYYQLRVDNQDLFDKLEEAQEANDKEAVDAVRATVVGEETFRDVERRVDAMNKGTREAPILPEIVNAFVEHMRIVDETSGNSAEAKLNRYDNNDLNEFLMDEDVWGGQKAELLDESKEYLDNYLVPRWRIEVNYREEDEGFDAIAEDDREARDAFLAGEGLEGTDLQRRIEYRQDRRRREAMEMSNKVTGDRFPTDQIETFVGYWEYPVKGFAQERYLVLNGGQDPDNLTGFAKAMHNIAGIDIPRPQDVPSMEYDNIYDEWKDDFTKLEGLADNESEFYVEDPDLRKQARDAMMFTTATQTYSGVKVKNKQATAFALASYKREAYGNFVPEVHIETYVAWKKISSEGKPGDWGLQTGQKGEALWFEDDWFMLEHMDFYRDVYMNPAHNNGIQREAWNFTR
ncbi:hypothetical protein LCGC14_2792550, partial [marine sediment metagenome]